MEQVWSLADATEAELVFRIVERARVLRWSRRRVADEIAEATPHENALHASARNNLIELAKRMPDVEARRRVVLDLFDWAAIENGENN